MSLVPSNFTNALASDRINAELRRAQRAAETDRIVFAVQSGTKRWKIARDMGVTERWVDRRITEARRMGLLA